MTESRLEEWARGVPDAIKNDAVWHLKAYRLGLYLSDLTWDDLTELNKDRRTRSLADQLCRAVGSISANVCEGFSRGSGKDRARFYEYALGSARESKDWYFKARHVLGGGLVDQRLALLVDLCRLLLTMVPDQRGHRVREEQDVYGSSADEVIPGQ